MREDQDYFIKYPVSQAALLRFSYAIVEGDQKKILYILLDRYAKHLSMSGKGIEPVYEKLMIASVPIDLTKLAQRGVLKKILLKITTGGQSFEQSSIQFDPEFEK